jgi:hypothetical protein
MPRLLRPVCWLSDHTLGYDVEPFCKRCGWRGYPPVRRTIGRLVEEWRWRRWRRKHGYGDCRDMGPF